MSTFWAVLFLTPWIALNVCAVAKYMNDLRIKAEVMHKILEEDDE